MSRKPKPVCTRCGQIEKHALHKKESRQKMFGAHVFTVKNAARKKPITVIPSDRFKQLITDKLYRSLNESGTGSGHAMGLQYAVARLTKHQLIIEVINLDGKTYRYTIRVQENNQ